MFNSASSKHWQVFQFANFPANDCILDEEQYQADRALAVADTNLLPEESAEITTITKAEIKPSDESEEGVYNKAYDKGYQAGFEIGKEEGFTVGKAQGYQSGHDIGHNEGQLAGEKAIRQQLADEIAQQRMLALETITQLVANFQHEIYQLDEQIVPRLVDIALIAAQKIVGKLTKNSARQANLIIRKLLTQYPPLGDNVQLHINPNDLVTIEKLLADELSQHGWQLILDDQIEAGGCKLISDKSEIDGTISSQWQRLASAAFKNSD